MANDTYTVPSSMPGLNFVYDKATDDPVGVTTPDGTEVKFGGGATPAAVVVALVSATTEQKAGVADALGVGQAWRLSKFTGTTDQKLSAAMAAMSAGDVLDLDGQALTLTGMATISKAVEFKNGRISGTGFRPLTITAAGAVLNGVSVSRIGAGLAASGYDGGEAIYCAAQCSILGGGRAVVHSDAGHAIGLEHASANGTRIAGNTIRSTASRMDASGVYGYFGSSGNQNIIVEDNTVECLGNPHGIGIYDATGGCRVRRNKISGARRIAEVPIAGWALVGGNVYRAPDRPDGPSRVLRVNGTIINSVELPGASGNAQTNPAANEWGVSAGYVYLNLGGANPSGSTITGQYLGGYGIYFYAVNVVSQDCIAEDNEISDCDGFGIYFQNNNAPTSRTHISRRNKLAAVCKEGAQVSWLPFGGIVFLGGNDCQSIDDIVEGSGTSTVKAPGVAFRVSSDGTMSGKIVNPRVSAASYGLQVTPGVDVLGGRVTGCYDANVATWNTPSGATGDVNITDLRSTGSLGAGLYLGHTAGCLVKVKVKGGAYTANAGIGVNAENIPGLEIDGATISGNAGGGLRVNNCAGYKIGKVDRSGNTGYDTSILGSSAKFAHEDFRDPALKSLFLLSDVTSGKYIDPTTGVLTTSASYDTSDFIPVIPGRTYYIRSTDATPPFGARFIAFFQADKSTVIVNAGVSDTTRKTYKVQAPTGAAWMRVSSIASQTSKMTVEDVPDVNGSRWAGLTWATIGDSVGALNPLWQTAVAAEAGLTHTNYSTGGTRISGTDANAMWQDARINAVPTQRDLIFLGGGMNDWAQSAPLGAATSTDTANFNGALNVAIEKMLARWPTGTIALQTVTYGERSTSGASGLGWANEYTNLQGLTTLDYAEAQRLACKRYGILCVDMGGLVGWSRSNVTTFVTDERVASGVIIHPNSSGAARMSRVAIGAIKSVAPYP